MAPDPIDLLNESSPEYLTSESPQKLSSTERDKINVGYEYDLANSVAAAHDFNLSLSKSREQLSTYYAMEKCLQANKRPKLEQVLQERKECAELDLGHNCLDASSKQDAQRKSSGQTPCAEQTATAAKGVASSADGPVEQRNDEEDDANFMEMVKDCFAQVIGSK